MSNSENLVKANSKVNFSAHGNTKKTFLDMENRLRFTADAHSIDIFTIVNILNDGIYSGLKEWYRNLAETWWKPQAPRFESDDRESAEDMISRLPIIVTGTRPGEIIIGTKTQSTNAIMRIYDAIVPPKTQVLDNIRGFEDLWERFLNKLGNIPYFEKLTRIEREMWLEYYQSDRDLYLEDVENLSVEILSFGSSDFLNLDEEFLETLGECGSVFYMRDIFDIFPKKPGSDGLKGRHTLVFRRGIWKVSTVYKEVTDFVGPTIDINSGKILNSVIPSNISDGSITVTFDSFTKKYLYSRGKNTVSEKQTIAVVFPPSNKFIINDVNLSKIINKSCDTKEDILCQQHCDEELEMVKKATRGFTAASYKSLLQKTIRFKALNVDLGGGYLMDANIFLRCTIALLLMNPGSFVPDIQRFVSGTESAFKRVVVTLFEDAYIPNNSEKKVLSVITGAFLAQRLPGWKPGELLVSKVMEIASIGYNSRKAFIFDTRQDRKGIQPYVLSETSKHFEAVSSIMNELRSFSSDLNMIRDITEDRYNGKEKITQMTIYPKIMPLCHCVDQHWAPEIAYMYPLRIVEKLKSDGSKPFSKLFIKLFSEVTGVNPRRPLRKGKTMEPVGYTEDFEDREFINITRKAQELTLKGKQNTPQNRKLIGGEYELEYNLDQGWISGMIGAVEVKGRPTALVTLHPDDPSILVAVRKPSRDMKDPFLSDEREADTIEEVKKRLKNGICLDQSRPPIAGLKGKKIIYDEDKSESGRSKNDLPKDDLSSFYISDKDGKNKVNWNSIKTGIIRIPYVEDVPYNMKNSLNYGGDGIVIDPFNKLEKVLNQTPRSYIQKLLTYFGIHTPTFEFKRIGREGGGSQGVVSIEDVGAFHLITKVKLFFPSAFERVTGSILKYRVKINPLVWLIKEHMMTCLLKGNSGVDQKRWGDTGEKIGREPWDHQISSLIDLQKSHKLGRKGNFIWIRVGLGKTFLVLSYLKWLQDTNTLTKYVIYTLPSSAIESVIQEIKNYGFKYRLLVPLKNIGKSYKTQLGKLKDDVSQGCEPLEYAINLIEHDHLRKCDEVLVDYMQNSIFIIDEVHKALNDTKRTAVALQLSHLSKEFVAMTGTPIIDTHTYKLIWWLAQIVPFEVNEKNFWVSANKMISRRVDTGVKVDRKDIYIPMTSEQEKIYQKLVPEGLGGKNSHPKYQDWVDAIKLCYEITDNGIISEIQKKFDSKGGESSGVFVVAENVSHQLRLKSKIQRSVIMNHRKCKSLKDSEIFLIEKGKSIFLTDESVRDGRYPDYKIVITTIRKVEGYTLTRFNLMLTSVYPSNNASREQVEGRINRICQSSDTVYYRTVHTGILTYTLQNHNDARNLSAVLATFSG